MKITLTDHHGHPTTHPVNAPPGITLQVVVFDDGSLWTWHRDGLDGPTQKLVTLDPGEWSAVTLERDE